jgi:hypothetical protein
MYMYHPAWGDEEKTEGHIFRMNFFQQQTVTWSNLWAASDIPKAEPAKSVSHAIYI